MKIHIQVVLDLLQFALTTKKYIYFSNILAELCDAVANLFREKIGIIRIIMLKIEILYKFDLQPKFGTYSRSELKNTCTRRL